LPLGCCRSSCGSIPLLFSNQTAHRTSDGMGVSTRISFQQKSARGVSYVRTTEMQLSKSTMKQLV
jgi:hypothetical protein